LELSEFMGVFLEELEEQLSVMEQKIVELEQQGASDEVVQTLFRVAHTIKGSSAAMGFEEMKDIVHQMEQVLDEVRNHRLSVSHAMIDVLFRCLDVLRDLKEKFSNGAAIDFDTTPIVADLKQILKSDNESDTVEPIEAQQIELQMELSQELKAQIEQAQVEGLLVYHISFRFIPLATMRAARAFWAVTQLRELGDILDTNPSMESIVDIPDGSLNNFHAVFATEEQTQRIQDAIDSPDIFTTQVKLLNNYDLTQVRNEGPEYHTNEVGTHKAQSIRVDVDLLENLMNLVGELVIDQARIEQVGQALNRRYKMDEYARALPEISSHVSRIVSQLQQSVMTARMRPIESLFSRFPRIVRDLSQTLGKDIELILEGGETRVDRTVIEEISDPLIHLIRNSVDHGIESPDKRLNINKPSKGTVKISAAHEENKVVITVEDDGNGIDPEKMKQSAVGKGLISEADVAKLSDDEAVNLIFLPGFSTAKVVSDISGRGVGMDIVRDHIEKLNGTIEIETKLGVGTKFHIKLPLTLTIIPGLLVAIEDETYVIPMNNVVEIIRVPVGGFQAVKNEPVILVRGQVVPVVDMRQFFNLNEQEVKKKYIPVVIVGIAERRIAMVVDELIGSQEIVRSSLGTNVELSEGISGGTILGNGNVGLILDVGKIVKRVAG
jgi:two-component system, chemotaxis family, sensor kinase CheA